MKKLFINCLFVCLVSKQFAQTDHIRVQPIDDFAKHIYAGTAINLGIGSIVYAKTKKTGLACVVGFATSVIAGGLKEVVYDNYMKRGVPSVKDFVSTAWGASIAFPIVRCGIDIHEKKQLRKEYFEFLQDSIRTDMKQDITYSNIKE